MSAETEDMATMAARYREQAEANRGGSRPAAPRRKNSPALVSWFNSSGVQTGDLMADGFGFILISVIWVWGLVCFANWLATAGFIAANQQLPVYLIGGLIYIMMTRFEVKYSNPVALLKNKEYFVLVLWLLIAGADIGGIFVGSLNILTERTYQIAVWTIVPHKNDPATIIALALLAYLIAIQTENGQRYFGKKVLKALGWI